VIRIAEEVRRAGVRAVALETSVVAQGLPAPHNLDAARNCARAVRERGAVPAFVAVIGGEIVVGASDEELRRLADPARKPAKAGSRDLAALCASGADAGTTVSATCAIAAQAGLRVFATGGIGGVHRRVAPGDPVDVSSDLLEVSRRPVCVVCAGPKAILDVPATAEALETLGVPVIGFRTSELPAFYTEGSGVVLEHRVEDAAEMAKLLRAHFYDLGLGTGVILAVPPPSLLPREEIEAAIAAALAEARTRRLPGKEVTPFLLGRVAEQTAGRSVRANLLLLENNAGVAAEVAVALAS